eukprot:TRINITY_DN8284_c0_g1_i2.p1 TRINITY_DN8284_c0_g1~~TRINITY_DN8284_c0_g1_i2.p1  ORF type:complete len:618 (+),score=185.52 TRINITY_DN8284_c0_g1_i2:235-2088(+)
MNGHRDANAIEAAMAFLDDDGQPSLVKFARKFFQDKSPANARYHRGAIPGPLLRQVYGDGDSDRCLSVWVTILRFMGDLPPRKNNPLTNLESVQLITNIALTRPVTRDEIICQILKQLTKNPNKTSHARGWILLALCVSVFVPSGVLRDFLRSFIAAGPPKYRDFVMQRFDRTVQLGPRNKPVTALDIEMAFRKTKLTLTVDHINGQTEIECDAQITAQEAVAQVFKNTSLEQEAGFSIYVTTPDGDVMTSVGAGSNYLMDAIFEYEVLASSAYNGDWQRLAQIRPWRLAIRKEVFAPWFEGVSNMEILWDQIMDGMERGFYICSSDTDMARLLAQLYYIDVGYRLDENRLKRMIRQRDLAGTERLSIDAWVPLVTVEFDRMALYSKPFSADDVKVDMVKFAREHWTSEFSRQFLNCDVETQDRNGTNVTVCVSCKGIQVLEAYKTTTRAGSATQTLARAEYLHTVDIGPVREADGPQRGKYDAVPYTFDVTTVFPAKQKLTITSTDAKAIHSLVSSYYKGLTDRAKYCMATMPYRAPTANSSFLSFDTGDIIILRKIWYQIEQDGWAEGIAEKDRSQGDFPSANVIVLPSISKPPDAVLNAYKSYLIDLAPSNDDI